MQRSPRPAGEAQPVEAASFSRLPRRGRGIAQIPHLPVLHALAYTMPNQDTSFGSASLDYGCPESIDPSTELERPVQPPTTNFLLKALVIPLFVATTVALWLSTLVSEPWAGLLVNLAAGFVGTVLTVLYVDVVLERHSAHRWKSVRERVNTRVERLANTSISSVRVALRFGPDVLDTAGNFANDTGSRRKAMIGIAEGVLSHNVGRIRDLDGNGWKLLARDLRGASELADQLFATFGTRIDAEPNEKMFNLQDIIGTVLGFYTIFPDLLGVPADKLPTKRDGSSSIAMQQTLYANSEAALMQLLAGAADLLRSLDDQSSNLR